MHDNTILECSVPLACQGADPLVLASAVWAGLYMTRRLSRCAAHAGGEAGMSKPQTWRLAETMARKALEQALTKPPDPPHQHEESLRLYLAILQVSLGPFWRSRLVLMSAWAPSPAQS